MLTLIDVTNFTRQYFAHYNIVHDWSLFGTGSMYSYELIVQPHGVAQKALLYKVFRGQDYIVDEVTNQIVVHYPIKITGQPPRIDQTFDCFNPYLSNLVGTTFQLQIVLAANDDEYQEAFSRSQKWEWLISSEKLTELFICGAVGNGGLEFLKLFHSCHQADINRDLTDEIPHMLNSWTMTFHEVLAHASDMSPNSSLFDADISLPMHRKANITIDSPMEAQAIYSLCSSLDVVERFGISLKNEVIEGSLQCLPITDIIYAVRHQKRDELFSSDPNQNVNY